MEPQDLLAIAATVLVASAFQGFLGFGFALLAMPLLWVQSDLLFAAGLVNLTGLIQAVMNAWVLREEVDRGYLLQCLPLGVLGLVCGTWGLDFLPRQALLVLLGGFTLLLAIANLRRDDVSTERRSAGPTSTRLAGFGAGLLAGLFNTPGPPIVADLYPRPLSPNAIRGTMIALLLAFMALRLPIALVRGQLSWAVGATALALVPSVALGLWIGVVLARRVSAERFRRVSWIALGAIGVAILVRSAFEAPT